MIGVYAVVTPAVGDMNLAWAVAGALLGALAGAALRGPVFRLSVPSGEPERTACPRCGTGPAASVAIRCRKCGGVFGPPWVFEVVTAARARLVVRAVRRLGGGPRFRVPWRAQRGAQRHRHRGPPAAGQAHAARVPGADPLARHRRGGRAFRCGAAAGAARRRGADVRVFPAGGAAARSAWGRRRQARGADRAGARLAGLAGPDPWGGPRLRAVRDCQPGAAGGAPDQPARLDLLRPVHARRRARRDPG